MSVQAYWIIMQQQIMQWNANTLGLEASGTEAVTTCKAWENKLENKLSVAEGKQRRSRNSEYHWYVNHGHLSGGHLGGQMAPVMEGFPLQPWCSEEECAIWMWELCHQTLNSKSTSNCISALLGRKHPVYALHAFLSLPWPLPNIT